MKLSVIMPAYNEVNTIENIIEQILKLDIDLEIIIIDDGSTDGTTEILHNKFDNINQIRIIYNQDNAGKGAAIASALNHARGEYIIIQDADTEYDPQDYFKLLECAMKNNADVIYGSRFYNTRHATFFLHFLVNKFLTVLTNVLYKSKLTDMETCYKLIRASVIKKINITSKGFEVEPEVTAKLLKNGYKIHEVPISYRGRSYREGKKIGWRDGVSAIWTLVKLRIKKSS